MSFHLYATVSRVLTVMRNSKYRPDLQYPEHTFSDVLLIEASNFYTIDRGSALIHVVVVVVVV